MGEAKQAAAKTPGRLLEKASVPPFIFGERPEYLLSQAARRMPAIPGSAQGLQKVFFELDTGIAGLADFQMETDLLLGDPIELTVQVLKESGTGLFAKDHRSRGLTWRAIAAVRPHTVGPTTLARTAE